ncbi:hypothetical protein [Pararhizobium arenae]|uniref:hypothetical protein n=1 Tax=Pararhizobium arenae TaxID=1856850 RepID=UPI000A862316|nr:hypothetical protein [Pararhizobium arenae]
MRLEKGADAHGKSGPTTRILLRLKRTAPGGGEIILGAIAWGLLMAAAAFGALYLQNRAETSRLASVLVLYLCGGVLAWPFALSFARFCAEGRRADARFAAYFFCLTVFTVLATAFLFAMQYRQFYERWHAPFGTRIWVYQFLFTGANSVYQFVVMGVRLFVPFGVVILAVASLWLARPKLSAHPHVLER